MKKGLHIIRAERGCSGTHVVIGGHRAFPEDAGLALASLLSERETGGEFIPQVTLLLRAPSDVRWVESAINWLRAHGRQVLIRTAVVLPKHLVRTIHEAEIPVALELAHQTPEIQRALLGPNVAPASALLLQAQHFEALGVRVVAHLGPLLPGVHDDRHGFLPLLHNLAAADVHDVRLSIGHLTGRRLAALAECLGPGALVELVRAFRLPPNLLVEAPSDLNATWRLDPLVARGVHTGLRHQALELGIRTDGCGCASFCKGRSKSAKQDYVPMTQADLFATTAV